MELAVDTRTTMGYRDLQAAGSEASEEEDVSVRQLQWT